MYIASATVLNQTTEKVSKYDVVVFIGAVKSVLNTMLRDQIYTHPTISEGFNDLLKKPVK